MSANPIHLLVTGATGKVGRHFIPDFLENAPAGSRVRALSHRREFPETPGVERVKVDLANREEVGRAMRDITHVVHLATCKEIPEDVMDVTVKGLFWLLEACRESECFQRFVLIGGDAAMGHWVYPWDKPITEKDDYRPYPGCYALSKVMEEVMLQQYYTQYDLDGCCLRAPWIMEKDDFKHSLSFGDDVFGAPRWGELIDANRRRDAIIEGAVPEPQDAEGVALKRNFVHVSDLSKAMVNALTNPAARQQLFHISMNEPVDYAKVSAHLETTRNISSIPIRTEFHSTWLDNTKARELLDWEPQVDLEKLIDISWDYVRDTADPRVIHYPG